MNSLAWALGSHSAGDAAHGTTAIIVCHGGKGDEVPVQSSRNMVKITKGAGLGLK